MLNNSISDQNKELFLMREKIFELDKEKNEEREKREKMEELIGEKEKEISNLTITNDLGIRTTSGEDLQKIRVLQEEIASLRGKEDRGDNELRPFTLKNKIKAIFKKYGFTVAAIFSAVGVVVGIIISSITPGLAKTNRILSNGLKNIEDKLKQLSGRPTDHDPGILRMITEFIFKTAGEVFGFLGNNTWLLIFLVVVLYISN